MAQRPLDAFKSVENDDAELLRDNILRKGQAAAIIHQSGKVDDEVFAIQTATALSIGKPFAGLFPARQIRVAVAGCRRDEHEIGIVRDSLEDYWKSTGWTDEEVQSAMQNTHITETVGKTRETIIDEIREDQNETPSDLVIICNLIGCYGDDPSNPSGQSLAQFLQAGLGSIQNGDHPCAVLGLFGCDDNDEAVQGFLNETRRTIDSKIKDKKASKIFASTIGRAIGEWASNIFALGYAQIWGEDILLLASVRTRGHLLWCCPAYGERASGHALRNKGDHFEEVHLKQLTKDSREIVKKNYSCADTLEAETSLLTNKER